MNKKDYILSCVSEEAAEVIAEIINLVQSNCQKFSTNMGFSEMFLKAPNIQKFISENNDLIGCIKLVEDNGILDFDADNESIIEQRSLTLKSKGSLDLLDMIKDLLHIQYTVSKLQRFGINHVHPVNKIRGRVNLKEAFYDYLAWVWLFTEEFKLVEEHKFFDKTEVYSKISKVNKYMKAAIEERVIREF